MFISTCPSLTQPSGFHVVSHSQKSPKPIVPKEKSYPSSRKSQKASASDGEVSISRRPHATADQLCFHLFY